LAFLAGTNLVAAALAAGFLLGFAGFLDEAFVTRDLSWLVIFSG
jgi:hypothetical protein